MNTFFNHTFWNTHALLVARILAGGFFLYAGIQKLSMVDGVAGMIGGAGFPAATLLTWIVIIFEILAGAAIILGKYFREAAILLALFTIIVSFLFHEVGDGMFLKNMAIAGGLLFMAAHGAGNTWRLNR